MTRTQFREIAERLTAKLAGFRYVDRFLYREPVEQILCGLHFEASRSRETFYMTAAVQPLYRPAEHDHFLFGQRLTGLWSTSESVEQLTDRLLSEIQENAIPLLTEAGTPEGFIRRFGLTRETPAGDLVIEESAYTLILLDRPIEATAWLQRLQDQQHDERFGAREVREEIAARAEMLLDALDRSSSEAKQVLFDWRQFTLRHLLPDERAFSPPDPL